MGMTQPTINNTQQWVQPLVDQQQQESALLQALQSKKGDNLANALVKQQYTPQPYKSGSVPQFGFVQPGEGGLGAAVTQGLNNYMQGVTWHQQQQDRNAYMQHQQDLAKQFDLAMAQKQQQDLAEASKHDQNMAVVQQNWTPIQKAAFDSLRPEEQSKVLQSYYGDIQGTGKGQETVAEKSAVLGHARGSGYGPENLEVNGIPQPGRVNSYKYMTGDTPTTSQDIRKANNELQKQQVDLGMAQNNLAAQPTQLKQEAEGRALENHNKQVQAKYAEALRQIDVWKGQNEMDKAQKEETRLNEGYSRWQEANAHYATMTPGQIKAFNAGMKSLGLPYTLVEKEDLKAVTEKGKVTQFYDPGTMQVYNVGHH